jgi:hypothetical protein
VNLIRFYVDVPSVQAAKQPCNLGQPLFDIGVAHSLNPAFELVVSEVSQKGRGLLIGVHEVLECVVAALLKAEVVAEGVCDQAIDLLFELQELL